MSTNSVQRVVLVVGDSHPVAVAVAEALAGPACHVEYRVTGAEPLAPSTVARPAPDGATVDSGQEPWEAVVAHHGRLDAVVSVIALPHRAPAGRVRVLEALDASVARVHAMAGWMHEHSPGGAIVTVTVAGESGTEDAATRGLLESAISTMTEELARRHPAISINAVLSAEPLAAALVAMLTGSGAAVLHGQVLRTRAPSPRRASAAPAESTAAPRRARAPEDDAIAIVGMGVAMPQASSPEQLWQLLCGTTPVFAEPGDRLDLDTFWSADPAAEDRTYSRVAGFMRGFEAHPRLRAELASGALASTEYTALWLRHCVMQATERVAMRPEYRQLFAVGLTPDGSQHLEQSLVVTALRQLLRAQGRSMDRELAALYPLARHPAEQVLPYRIARQAAGELAAGSEIVVVDTACSSSLYTIDLGVRALRARTAEVALCGGAFALNAQSLVLFSKLHGLSRTGEVRSLDRSADGVLFSDGAAMLVMKRREQALADGDPILGYVESFGGSSDGRGKAIYAPNAAGQRFALQRAWRGAGVTPRDIDWVLAHATGTPTGDRTELTALTENAGPDKKWLVTSNKSLVGHSGWAAGAVSVVHALLAMRHGRIPGQRRFSELGPGMAASIEVPVADVPWPPRDERPRRVGISAMGFGGTNGHLIVSDTATAPLATVAPSDEPLVLVAWGAHLPAQPSREQVERWFAGGAPSWPASFGEHYPLPSPMEARLAPSALAAMDRSQLMALRCADLVAGEWSKDVELAARSGVFVGHSGPTRSAIGYDLRCYLNDVCTKLPDIDSERLGAAIRAQVRAANEDSYPGLMPNIIAARVVQRLDLHGPNMTLDAGRDSVSSALSTACRYLLDGEIDLAIVMGVNATTEHVTCAEGYELAEAAIGLVVTRQSLAKGRGWPVLGTFALEAAAETNAPSIRVPGNRAYRGAEGAVALLHALFGPGRGVLQPLEDRGTPAISVVRPGLSLPLGTSPAMAGAGTPPPPAGEPSTPLAGVLQRHAVVLREVPGRAERPRIEAIPAGCLVVTDDATTLATWRISSDCLVVTSGAVVPGMRAVHVDRAEELAGVLAGRTFSQVRVVVSSHRQRHHDVAVMERLMHLADLAFVSAQLCAESLIDGGCYAALMLDAFEGAVPLPYVGVFSGLVRSLEQELPGCVTFALVTESDSAAVGLAELTEESANHRFLPLAFRRSGRRCESLLVELEPQGDDDGPLGVVERPVLVATGGARGLTAHLVQVLAAAHRPRSIWLLGTGAMADEEAQRLLELPRAEAIRALMQRHPGENLARISKRHDDLVHAAERLATLQQLRTDCQLEAIHYRQCDMLDDASVRRVVAEILDVEGSVDVLVHGAGLVRTATLARKKLSDLRAVRDVKVLGYARLRAAFGVRQPKLWCSISSVSAFMGRQGEPDYCAGNEFLLLAAAHQRAVHGRDEVALVSALWVESGMASADTVGGAFLARQGDIGQMNDAQGREFFRREVRDRGSHGLATTWIGSSDWRTVERKAPGFRDFCKSSAAEPEVAWTPRSQRRAFLTTAPFQRTAHGASWLIAVDLDAHPYLLDHLVDGRPTIPGTFILEIGAEVALELAPELTPAALTDVVLSRFIRAPRERWPRTLLVVGAREGDQVQVRISTPASGPVPELEHTRMIVQMARSLPPGPFVPGEDDLGTPAPNTYQLPGTPVKLTGVFEALREPRLHASGGSASLRLRLPQHGGCFAGFVLPSIALDCLLRTIVLDGRDRDAINVMVPTSLDRIELHTAANDVELAALWPEGVSLRHGIDASGRDYCVAVAPDGRPLIQVTGIAGAVKGKHDRRTGQWLP